MEKVRVGDLKIDAKLTELRPINVMFVSRYRQAYRSEANMPRIIVEAGTDTVVSGNHRVTALLDEYGEDYEVGVEYRKYDSRRELLEDFARENVAHGNPLEGVSRARIAHSLLREGATDEEVASLFNVSVRRITEWCGMTVAVIGGRSKKPKAEIIKRGPDIVGDTITREQYQTHMKRDRGVTAYSLAHQLSRWLRQGWVKHTDEKSIKALRELLPEIEKYLQDVMEATNE